MKTVEEIRRKNLEYLIKQAGSVAAVAAKLGMESSSQVSQWRNQSPDSKTGKPRQISAPTARRIEKAYGRPHGWFDNPIDESDQNEKSEYFVHEQSLEYGPEIASTRRVPIVGTAQMGDDGYWYEIDYPVGHGDGYVEVSTKDQNAYSLRVRGQSMYPAIRDGWIVVCEPNAEPMPGEFVMVKTMDGRSMVKELLYSRADGVSLMSVNNGFDRIVLSWSEIDKMHPVTSIIMPSKTSL